MDVSVPLWLLALIGIIAALAVGFAIKRPGSGTPAPADSPAAPAWNDQLPPFAQELEQLQVAGRWDEIPRLLDRRLPEWTVSSSLIEVSRALGALERDLATVPATPVTEVVTSRLAQQTGEVSRDLWRLAARIDVAARQGNRQTRRELDQEDEALVRLLAAIKDARAEVAELTLGPTGSLDRAEGRFRALAATARELHDLEQAADLR